MPRRPSQDTRSPGLFGPDPALRSRHAPLASRMRPRNLDEYVGQDHLVGPRRILRRLIEAGRLPSLLFWGPPGTGKTTLARLLAGASDADFAPLSAVSAGVADLRKVIADARRRWDDEGAATVLFLDEIHRFNKAQQDAILPHVEDGTVTLIGATTENPSFEVIGPLLSRCRVFDLKPLTPEQIEGLLVRALEDESRGLGGQGLIWDDDALSWLARMTGGDARMALTGLQVAADSVPTAEDGARLLQREHVAEALQVRTQQYDKKGERHYDTISAFIKSVRGSDVDASLYWLARMLEAGEDPLFVVRRLVILAAEDIGMADPRGLMVAVACQQAVHFLGLPEGSLAMAQCTIYLASAPKSNSAMTSYLAAASDARDTQGEAVPLHLRNAPTGLMKSMGYGDGYQYAHDHSGNYVEQQHLPDGLIGRQYYQPGEMGYEKKVKDWYEALRKGPSRGR